jgi:acylphosphatase
MEEIHVQVSGSVQGVGFRSLVSRYAEQYEIKGFVRNLPNGMVEICAQGSSRQIRQFFEAIRNQPGRASIDRFDEKIGDGRTIYSSFTAY